jgi:predicted ester cyclase
MLIVGLAAGCVSGDEPSADVPADDVTGDGVVDVVARTLEARNKDLLHRYHVEVWDEGHLDQAWKYLGEGFTSHATVTTMPPGQQPGPDFLAQFWSGFPDLRSHEDALLGDGDLVTIRWTITGTHTGTFFGIAPTGSTIQVSGMDILRVASGKLVEHWGGVADQMDDFLAQIGAGSQ